MYQGKQQNQRRYIKASKRTSADISRQATGRSTSNPLRNTDTYPAHAPKGLPADSVAGGVASTVRVHPHERQRRQPKGSGLQRLPRLTCWQGQFVLMRSHRLPRLEYGVHIESILCVAREGSAQSTPSCRFCQHFTPSLCRGGDDGKVAHSDEGG
jgi:hypothetical protein